MSFFGKLIRNNTGVSSKNFFLVIITIIGAILLIVPGFVLVWEVVATGTIATDITAIAAYIGAVASLFATAGVTKVWSEKHEKPFNNDFSQSDSDETDELHS